MNNQIAELWKQVHPLRGCLSHQKTILGRRRLPDIEDPFQIENPFVGDEAKLLSSKAYRTLDSKTQVFTCATNKMIRTRGTHVREVQAVSVIAAELLGLNTDLVRAGAIGHDIGHVPLGHQGEAWIAQQTGLPFCHEVMGVIIAQRIERKGMGLNLTFETLEAMMRHSGNTAKEGMSPEAWVLRHTDKFAYIFHDVNDIERMGYALPEKLMSLVNEFGTTQRMRTSTALAGLVIESAEQGKVSFEKSELGAKFQEIRKLMYEVYPCVSQQDVSDILGPTVDFLKMLKRGDPFFLLSLMTDHDVLMIKNHTGMRDIDLLNRTAVKEVIPHLASIGPIDLCDPGLGW